MKNYTIKEVTIDFDDASGVHAISFVQDPAIEVGFEYFASSKRIIKTPLDVRPEDLNTKFKWVLGGDNPCPACYSNSQFAPMELSDWIQNYGFPRTEMGHDIQGVLTIGYEGEDGTNYATYCRKACQCYFESVDNYSKETIVQFKVENFEKRIVKGLVLQSNQMIYRNNVDGEGTPGYVYFSRNTVRQMKDKYGFNRKITFQHQEDRTGDAIMLDSYLEEDENTTKWYVSYKIVGDTLWEYVKTKKVIGFSIEALLKIN